MSRAFDPRDYQAIVGKTFADNDHWPILQLGKRRWTRWELGVMGVPHAGAAKAVHRIIQTEGITTPSELARAIPKLRQYKKFGVTAYYVVLAIIHAAGSSVKDAHNDNRTFHTLHRARKKKKS